MAFDEEKVVVCDIFSCKDVIVDSCSINEEMGTIIIKGHMLNDKYGVYALKIVNADNMAKALIEANPQNIISPDQKNRPFTVSFNNAAQIIADPTPKIVEVYLRVKPEQIKYNTVHQGKVSYANLDLGCRIPFETFPHEQQIKEQKQEEQNELNRFQEDLERKRIEKEREKEERQRRQNIDNDA
jgi:hypothetical protein